MHDKLDKSEGTVLEADFYHADQLLPRSDEDLVAKVKQRKGCLRRSVFVPFVVICQFALPARGETLRVKTSLTARCSPLRDFSSHWFGTKTRESRSYVIVACYDQEAESD